MGGKLLDGNFGRRKFPDLSGRPGNSKLCQRELINRPRFRPFSKHICPRNPFSIHQFFDGDLQFQMAFSFAKVSRGSQEVIHQFLPATLSDVLCALFPLQICGPD